MGGDGLEVLETDTDPHAVLDLEVVKVGRVEGDAGLQRLLDDLLAIDELLGEAGEGGAARGCRRGDVELLGLGAEVLHVLLQQRASDLPVLGRHPPVEDGVHNVHVLVRQPVCLQHPVVAVQLD